MQHPGPTLHPGSGAEDPSGAEAGATFGIYEEGAGVRSLYLHPLPLEALSEALLPHLRECKLALLSDGKTEGDTHPVPGGGWLGPGRMLSELEPPFEAAFVRRDVLPEQIFSAFPPSILGRPPQAVPEALGTRLALAMGDARHSVILTRDSEILRSALQALFSGLSASLDDGDEPSLPLSVPDPLLEPLPEGAWHRVTTRNRARYRALVVETFPGKRRSIWGIRRGAATWQVGGAW